MDGWGKDNTEKEEKCEAGKVGLRSREDSELWNQGASLVSEGLQLNL